MKVRYFSLVFFLFVLQAAAAQQNIDRFIQNLLTDQDYNSAQVGIHVRDVNSGETIYALNAEKLFIPASTMKLITTATAFEILGADYRFNTKIGYEGKIKNNVLNGNLIVKGGGDPTLGSEYFNEYYFNPHFLDVWAEQLRNFGIQQIEGDLIFDGTVYDEERIPATWIWEDIGNYYGAGPNGLTVYDNMFRITFKSPKRAGEETSVISIYPEIEGIELKNEVLSSDINKDLAYVFGSPLDNLKLIRGTIPKNRKSFTIKASIQKPEELLANELIRHLAKKGIFINGEILFEKTNPSKSDMIYVQESPTLEEIIKVTNVESINLFAEHLLMQMSAEKDGLGNRVESIEIIKAFWKKNGISTDNFFMEDGSGLSHFNAVSPVFFTSVLNFMFNESYNYTSFFNSLPTAGDGTLSSFKVDNFQGNSLRAKSGSMTRVRCYSGYLKTNSGKNFAFSIMVNHYSGSASKLTEKIQKLLIELSKVN